MKLALCTLFALLLQAAPPLAIVNAVIHQIEDGTAATAPQSFTTGEVVFFSFQVNGYSVSPAQKVKLSARIQAFDQYDAPLQEAVSSDVDAEVTPNDKEWRPKFRAEIPIPPLALPGSFKVTVKVVDELNGAVAEKAFPLIVAGREIPLSQELIVRSFGFFRTENEASPLATAAYRPGDTVWARFDITGYRLGEGNRIDVEYGVAVLSPSGKVLFAEPRAAAEQSQSFYPKRYFPNSFNLSIQPKTAPGVFTIVLTVKDNIGKQVYETKQTFSVE